VRSRLQTERDAHGEPEREASVPEQSSRSDRGANAQVVRSLQTLRDHRELIVKMIDQIEDALRKVRV
jgi:hypothetical protein